MTGVLYYDILFEQLLDPDVADSDLLSDPDVANSEPLPNYSDVAAADVAAIIDFVTVVPVVVIVVVIEILKYYLELILFKN
ncbi:hypothetical protein RCL_jg5884.t1 [Rhizophagus clarus]|uniref:Uncharacterized protein n=1 Tax=Rhizophagus clarus TaxID=94130 RepID=A0A8H3LT85_9GLOM|nr:hypothetical protein RCL_jg5884.t1 [Rhizophagus clarus]